MRGQSTDSTQSLFIGTWELNLDKSEFVGPAPLGWTDVFREIEGDQYEVTTKIILPDGSTMDEKIIWPRQGGVAVFLQGGAEEMTEVETFINPNEWLVTRMMDGKQIGSINLNVSKDGKTMRYAIRIPGIMEGEAVFDKQ